LVLSLTKKKRRILNKMIPRSMYHSSCLMIRMCRDICLFIQSSYKDINYEEESKSSDIDW